MIKKFIRKLLGQAEPPEAEAKTAEASPAPASSNAKPARGAAAVKKPRGKAKGAATDIPVIAGPAEHGIDPALISRNAVRVTDTLQEAGFRAFIVGGAVRDLLLGVAPKDFDVATDATPEQVQRLFRRARLIGRAFRSCTCNSART